MSALAVGLWRTSHSAKIGRFSTEFSHRKLEYWELEAGNNQTFKLSATQPWGQCTYNVCTARRVLSTLKVSEPLTGTMSPNKKKSSSHIRHWATGPMTSQPCFGHPLILLS